MSNIMSLYCVLLDSGNVLTKKSRFMAELGVKIQDSATFSVVKLEHIWKEEIEFSQSLSAMIKAYYHFVVSE